MSARIARFAVLAALGAMSGTAVAEPAPAEALHAAAPAPPPTYAVDLGVTFGDYHDLFVAGATLGAAVRLGGSPLWAHAQGTLGDTSQRLSGGTGTFRRLGGGVDARSCTFRDKLCLFVGADVGYIRADWTGIPFSFDPNPPMSTIVADHVTLAPRAGFDVGNRRWRFQGTVEFPLDVDGTARKGGEFLAWSIAIRD